MKNNIDKFDFRGIYTLDLANNHEGELEHGLAIIRHMGQVVSKHRVRAALKFQFRDFDTLIHADHRENSDNNHIPRFLKNALVRDDFAKMADAVRDAGMITMATPFDEPSMDLINALEIEVVKIASCSADDWPLLEYVVNFSRPVVVSTGGLSHESIDDVVSFFEHRGVDFAIMHCVSIYPTSPADLQLGQIAEIKRRHPGRVVGWSTHEDPNDMDPIIAATAIGAEMQERHVGLNTPGRELNKYSSTPEQVDRWIASGEKAKTMMGGASRTAAKPAELESLRGLKRGVFVARALKAGGSLKRKDVYFAMPASQGQILAGELKDGIKLKTAVAKNGALEKGRLEFPPENENSILIHSVHDIKTMFNLAQIALPIDFMLEFSHHYGISRFRDVGAVIIDCVNREYCKKLIVQLPGQSHPLHCHKKKEESFHVLYGSLDAHIDGRYCKLQAGDLIVVPRGVWHCFSTETGVIFEEISTTHHNDDSYYKNKEINQSARSDRKTIVQRWGDFQWNN